MITGFIACRWCIPWPLTDLGGPLRDARSENVTNRQSDMKEISSLPLSTQHIIVNSAKGAVPVIARKYLGKKGVDPRFFSHQDIEDIVGRTILKSMVSFGSYDESKAKLSTWISRIAFHCVIDEYASIRSRESISYSISVPAHGGDSLDLSEDVACTKTEDTPFLASTCSADAEAEFNELEECVLRELEGREETDSICWTMRQAGYGPKEIAGQLGCTPNAVSVRLSRVKNDLAGALGQYLS